jgi:hypothetical protein
MYVHEAKYNENIGSSAVCKVEQDYRRRWGGGSVEEAEEGEQERKKVQQDREPE